MVAWVVIDAKVDLPAAVWIPQSLLQQRQELPEVGAVGSAVELAEHVLLQRRPYRPEHCDSMRVLVERHGDDLVVVAAPRFALENIVRVV